MSEAGHTERLEAALDGKYRIERKLGEGGMASVYLAEDIKHQRKVALKILRPELAAVIGAERFLSEIRTTANLQHPHILALFDSGEAGGYLYYVMPYIDGETLREKLDREKQLGVEEAVRIARDVADALDYAHRAGVIHRDIKPGNILLHDGRPVVADFGIALAVSAAGGGRMTETGLSLGTPHYMSPEQASADRDLTARSDVYSLGCVLYEMLAGQPPHTGPSAQSILVHILTKDVTPLTEHRHTVPAHVSATVAKSIEKLPADRFETAKEFMEALGDEGFAYQAKARSAPTTPEAPAGIGPASARSWLRDPRSAVAALALALAAWAWLTPPPPPPPLPTVHVTRASVDLGEIELGRRDEVIVSPDGSRFAVAGAVDGVRSVYWRNASEESFRIIPGTETVGNGIAFSPEGDWIVYSDQDQGLQKVSLLGGAPTTVVARGGPQTRESHWGDDGMIVFSGGPTGLYRVPDTGGEPEPLLVRSGSGSLSLLPGGRAVLGAQAETGVWVLDLDTDSLHTGLAPGFDPKYVATGHILYADLAGGLWALPFDPTTITATGAAVPVLDGVSTFAGPVGMRFARYSVSQHGTLVYGAGGAEGSGSLLRRLLVVNIESREVEEPSLEPREFQGHRFSPDGRFIAYHSVEAGDSNADIFTYDLELGTAPRALTFDGQNSFPVWSPDGSRIAFRSGREGTLGFDLFVKDVNDNSPPELIVSLPETQTPNHWLSDDLLVFHSGATPDLWLADLSADSVVVTEYLRSEGAQINARVSPAGDLLVYSSDDTGRPEIYVRSFPEAEAREAISRSGGRTPMWSPDGDAVYYWTPVAPFGSVISLVRARIDRGPPFAVLSTDTVWEGPHIPNSWSLHPDGDRMVVIEDVVVPVEETAFAPEPERHIVVTNWFAELRERLGEN